MTTMAALAVGTIGRQNKTAGKAGDVSFCFGLGLGSAAWPSTGDDAQWDGEEEGLYAGKSFAATAEPGARERGCE
jgi:hypothetical protein